MGEPAPIAGISREKYAGAVVPSLKEILDGVTAEVSLNTAHDDGFQLAGAGLLGAIK